MTITVTGLTVAEAATMLNATTTVIQYTLVLAIVAILAKVILADVHPAITWSVVARELHASLWPTLLRADSSHGAAPRVALLSNLGLVSTVLIAVTGVVTPLGLKTGPLFASRTLKPMNSNYVEDTSPLALAAYDRSNYVYSRKCSEVACPGNSDVKATAINPSIIDIFKSTPHGPFNMQYRQYYVKIIGDNNASIIQGQFSTQDSLILQDGIFAVEGAIVDLTGTPGIGLINHTMPPSLKYGGIWSQEMLWLEPVTACVDTNLTIDYSYGMELDTYGIDALYLSDLGGFVNLTSQLPTLNLNGQNINLYQHAYAGAVLSNRYSMYALNNHTSSQSNTGKTFPLSLSRGGEISFIPGVVGTGDLKYFFKAPSHVPFDQDITCNGYNGQDTVNISSPGVHCGTFLGPPYRTDGGDERLEDVGSRWRQNLHVCASVTKASIQRVGYSFNGTASLLSLNISRSLSDEPVIWAMEKTDMKILDVGILWGRVADSYEFDPNLTTIRARQFYIPASTADEGFDSGLATNVHGLAWSYLYMSGLNTRATGLVDYSGSTNVALLKKYQSIIYSNSTHGVAHIVNLIWTDIMVNNLISTDASKVLMVAAYRSSISYDLKYGIPLILLIVIWLPSFTMALVVLVFGRLKFSLFKNLLNHTSIGRIITGHSAFKITSLDGDGPALSLAIYSNEKNWVASAGQTQVSYNPHTNDPDEENDHVDASEM